MLHIGTSGWQYADWRGRFYPQGLPPREWLPCYAASFHTVEVNNTFYRLPQRQTFTGWAKVLPPGFVMAVKMSRYLTHVKRLADPAEPVARFLERAGGLGDHLGPVLLQLSPNLQARPAALDAALRAFPRGTRLAVEPRHDSWFSDEVRAVLESHDAALCWADRLGRPLTPLWRTASFGYVRMHEGRGQATSYGTRAIETWVERIEASFDASDDVYVYFNTDHGAAAVHNAQTMIRRAGAPVPA